MTLKRVEQAASRLQAAAARHETAKTELQKAVKEARKNHTLAEIGAVLGITRQGVYDLLKR